MRLVHTGEVCSHSQQEEGEEERLDLKRCDPLWPPLGVLAQRGARDEPGPEEEVDSDDGESQPREYRCAHVRVRAAALRPRTRSTPHVEQHQCRVEQCDQHAHRAREHEVSEYGAIRVSGVRLSQEIVAPALERGQGPDEERGQKCRSKHKVRRRPSEWEEERSEDKDEDPESSHLGVVAYEDSEELHPRFLARALAESAVEGRASFSHKRESGYEPEKA
mmetsp:Transcript_749/g.2657  ORF Transcript_749/g.2657 Transcript_749/m.2657 type:complete len:220 (+) Transcript_749:2291-2950(+)|eukprot:scaffold270607_cov36-Tisochrysis_lutea.AAC.1